MRKPTAPSLRNESAVISRITGNNGTVLQNNRLSNQGHGEVVMHGEGAHAGGQIGELLITTGV